MSPLNNFRIARASTLFRPQHIASDMQCVSQKLMFRDGFTFPCGTGTLYFLPMFVRALEKLVGLIDCKMRDIGAQKILMPCLTSASLFKKSGRWTTMGDELFRLKDRHDFDYCLGPTHEESVTNLIASVSGLSHRCLPIILYQITTKFRDERRPKFGALRAREFIMTDIYSFDRDCNEARTTYDLVCKAYDELFESLEVKVAKVRGSTGTMGGDHSDEYHLLSDIGEDKLLLCNRCNYGVNAEFQALDVCPRCNTTLQKSQGIEVGHAFLLGTTYSEPFEARYVTEDSPPQAFYMGCYGLGTTRIVAAISEVMAEGKESMRWPLSIAPFLVGIVPPKKGSKEWEAEGMLPHLVMALCESVPALRGNVLLDDRSSLTIGRRVNDLGRIGIPYAIVLGKRALEERPLIEVVDVYRDTNRRLTQAELLDFFRHQFS